MKVAGYVRVSTTEQVEHGQGLDIQVKRIEDWARSNGHKLTMYEDAGVTGTTEDREGLTEAIASIRFNGNEALVVASLDRLARNLTVQEGALATIWNSGGRVFTVEDGEVLEDDPSDPMRTFIRQVMGAVSQLEAGMVRARLARGRKAKAESGGYAGGAPPYGFRAEGRELVEDDHEQTIISMMRARRSEGQSLRHIANYLNELHIPAKNGGQWFPTTVSRALESPSQFPSPIPE